MLVMCFSYNILEDISTQQTNMAQDVWDYFYYYYAIILSKVKISVIVLSSPQDS